MKSHYRIYGFDHRDQGQSDYEYNHQSICGYVRKEVTRELSKVDCKLCLRELKKIRVKK